MGRRYRPQCRRSGRLCMLVPSQSKSLALTRYGLDAPWPAVRSGCTGAVSTAQSQGMAMHSCSESEHGLVPPWPARNRNVSALSAHCSPGGRPSNSVSEHASGSSSSAPSSPVPLWEVDVPARQVQHNPDCRRPVRADAPTQSMQSSPDVGRTLVFRFGTPPNTTSSARPKSMSVGRTRPGRLVACVFAIGGGHRNAGTPRYMTAFIRGGPGPRRAKPVAVAVVPDRFLIPGSPKGTVFRVGTRA